MKFTKMHGIGNDYIYLNGFEQHVDNPAELAIRMADRHFGIGGDGLILILPADSNSGADVRMRMFNADGSEAEMCGNGIRCVAKYAHDHGLSAARPMVVQTRAGVLSIDYMLDAADKLATATVDMGQPILEAAKIPLAIPNLDDNAHAIDLPFEIDSDAIDDLASLGLPGRVTCLSMGNPHAVFFCDDLASVPVDFIGPMIEQHPVFPNRVNVHFVELQGDDEVAVEHWERGSGATLACGTGACAVCVAGVMSGRTRRRIVTHLPGGNLELEWRESDNHVYMTGPATEVFTGEWPE